MIFYIQKRAFRVFFQSLHQIDWFFIIYQNMLLGNGLPWLPTIQSHSKEKLAQAVECRGGELSIDTKH